MKRKVVITEQRDVVSLDEVSAGKHYAFSKEYKSKHEDVGFAIRSGYESENKKGEPLYIDRALHEFEEGNNWTSDPTPLKLLVQDKIAQGYDVYQFDTVQELFGWLSKQSSDN